MSLGAEHGTERSATAGRVSAKRTPAPRSREATTIAIVVAGGSSLVAVVVLLLGTGPTNWLAVALTCVAAVSCFGGYAMAIRRGEPRQPESMQNAAAAPGMPVARDAGDASARLALLEDAVELVDELDRHREDVDETQRRLLDHVVARIAEILQRSDVEVITGDDAFNRNRHAAADSAQARPGAPIAETLSPGFIVERRVLRRARVRLTESER